MKEIISSLDIGSSTIKLVVGEVYKNEVNILAVSEVKSKGIKKGIITNQDETLSSLKEVFTKCEESLSIKIDKVILNIPSYNAEFIASEGKINVTSDDGKVSSDDIIRVLQACVFDNIPSNKEFVSIMPIEFKIDGDKVVENPKGIDSQTLYCKAMINIAPKKDIYSSIALLENTGVTVADINFGCTSDYYQFKNNKMNNKNACVINIGDEKTEVSVFKKGILIETETIEIGGKNIDRDICYIYDISRKQAKELKEKFALASKRNASTSWTDEILTNNKEMIKVNQYEVSEIIYSRIKEILELAQKQINLLTNLEISYIIITGGTTEINDFNLVVDEVFGKEMEVYKVKELGCRNNKFSSAIGLIKFYHEKLAFRDKLAYTVDSNKQTELLNIKKLNNSNIFEKLHEYFFEN